MDSSNARSHNKRDIRDWHSITWLLPAFLLLLIILCLALATSSPLANPAPGSLFVYDFRHGEYPSLASGSATLTDEDNNHALYFDEVGEDIVSETFTLSLGLRFDIRVVGLRSVGHTSLVNDEPCFTIDALDESMTVIDTKYIDSVEAGNTYSVQFMDLNIKRVRLELTDFATMTLVGHLVYAVMIDMISATDIGA
jgi:hypothetical protein